MPAIEIPNPSIIGGKQRIVYDVGLEANVAKALGKTVQQVQQESQYSKGDLNAMGVPYYVKSQLIIGTPAEAAAMKAKEQGQGYAGQLIKVQAPYGYEQIGTFIANESFAPIPVPVHKTTTATDKYGKQVERPMVEYEQRRGYVTTQDVPATRPQAERYPTYPKPYKYETAKFTVKETPAQPLPIIPEKEKFGLGVFETTSSLLSTFVGDVQRVGEKINVKTSYEPLPQIGVGAMPTMPKPQTSTYQPLIGEQGVFKPLGEEQIRRIGTLVTALPRKLSIPAAGIDIVAQTLKEVHTRISERNPPNSLLASTVIGAGTTILEGAGQVLTPQPNLEKIEAAAETLAIIGLGGITLTKPRVDEFNVKQFGGLDIRTATYGLGEKVGDFTKPFKQFFNPETQIKRTILLDETSGAKFIQEVKPVIYEYKTSKIPETMPIEGAGFEMTAFVKKYSQKPMLQVQEEMYLKGSLDVKTSEAPKIIQYITPDWFTVIKDWPEQVRLNLLGKQPEPTLVSEYGASQILGNPQIIKPFSSSSPVISFNIGEGHYELRNIRSTETRFGIEEVKLSYDVGQTKAFRELGKGSREFGAQITKEGKLVKINVGSKHSVIRLAPTENTIGYAHTHPRASEVLEDIKYKKQHNRIINSLNTINRNPSSQDVFNIGSNEPSKNFIITPKGTLTEYTTPTILSPISHEIMQMEIANLKTSGLRQNNVFVNRFRDILRKQGIDIQEYAIDKPNYRVAKVSREYLVGELQTTTIPEISNVIHNVKPIPSERAYETTSMQLRFKLAPNTDFITIDSRIGRRGTPTGRASPILEIYGKGEQATAQLMEQKQVETARPTIPNKFGYLPQELITKLGFTSKSLEVVKVKAPETLNVKGAALGATTVYPRQNQQVRPTQEIQPSRGMVFPKEITPTIEITPSKLIEPSRTIEPTRMIEPSRSFNPSKEITPTKIITPSRTLNPSRTVEPTRTIEPSRIINPSRTITPSKLIEPSRTIEPTRQLTPSKTIEPTKIIKPPETPPPKGNISSLFKTKVAEGYVTLFKRHGKFLQPSSGSLTREAALSFGQRLVKGGLSRSFKIRPTGTNIVEQGENRFRGQEFYKPKTIKPTQAGEEIFTQKPKFTIATLAEKIGLKRARGR